MNTGTPWTLWTITPELREKLLALEPDVNECEAFCELGAAMGWPPEEVLAELTGIKKILP